MSASIGHILSVAKDTVSRIPEIFVVGPAPQVPRPLPEIDMSRDVIVIWVPGTSNHNIHPRFERDATLFWGDRASLVLAQYQADWRLSSSIPDGFRELKNIVDYVLKHRRKGQRVVLAGESQGALIIGELMARPEYYAAIDKAVLMGHPGISEKHYDNDPKVLEINNPADPATFQWPGDAVEIIRNVDKFFKKDMSSIPFFIKTIASAPFLAAHLVGSQLNSIPLFKEHFPHPHNYSSRMPEAVLWLAH